jgi:hypothetical protein
MAKDAMKKFIANYGSNNCLSMMSGTYYIRRWLYYLENIEYTTEKQIFLRQGGFYEK